MNPSAILALISELYEQVASLTKENESLRAALSESNSENESTEATN